MIETKELSENMGEAAEEDIHCRPCGSDLSDLQGKKLAATTADSDGLRFKALS